MHDPGVLKHITRHHDSVGQHTIERYDDVLKHINHHHDLVGMHTLERYDGVLQRP